MNESLQRMTPIEGVFFLLSYPCEIFRTGEKNCSFLFFGKVVKSTF